LGAHNLLSAAAHRSYVSLVIPLLCSLHIQTDHKSHKKMIEKTKFEGVSSSMSDNIQFDLMRLQ
jgi:hypothetical protein